MKYWPLGLLVAVLSLAAACGGSDSDTTETPEATGPTATVAVEDPTGADPTATVEDAAASPAPPENSDGPVAIVNGTEITREEFDQEFALFESNYVRQGGTMPQGEELEALRQEVVTQLVQQELVLQESEARGITAEPDEIDTRYQQTVEAFPDEATFTQALEEAGVSEDELKALVEENIRIEKVLDAVIADADLSPPTEEELRGMYDVASQQQELPAFEEVRAQLEAELMNQREDEVLRAFVQQLEQDGEVEILGS